MEFVRQVEPLASDWRSFAWPTGRIDTGWRPFTSAVEGRIRTPEHLLLATLSGGAERLSVQSDCGHRYVGRDFHRAVSFVPACRERVFTLQGVASRWGSISLSPSLFLDESIGGSLADRVLDGAMFTNGQDPYIHGLIAEMSRVLLLDGNLDLTYCSAVSLALACYISQRYGEQPLRTVRGPSKLSRWRTRRIEDFVRAHLDRPITVEELAEQAGLSPGHLHRSFKAAWGVTPLAFINRLRIEASLPLLHQGDVHLRDVAHSIGLQSASHFVRMFKAIHGITPGQYRAMNSRRKSDIEA